MYLIGSNLLSLRYGIRQGAPNKPFILTYSTETTTIPTRLASSLVAGSYTSVNKRV